MAAVSDPERGPAGPDASDGVERTAAALRARVDAWFEASESAVPVGPPRVSVELDDALKSFVMSNVRSVRLVELDAKARRWVHMRAEQLGLRSKLFKQGKRFLPRLDVDVEKPDAWVQDWDAPAAPVALRQTSAPKRKPEPIRHAPDYDDCVECDVCGDDIVRWDALYHWSGMGPLCEECIEDDDELCGLKWEPMHG
jgi:hypothetical protein